jgi:hypothetical protein
MTMASDESALEIISRMFVEAARTHGDDPLGIVRRVEALVESLDPGQRLAVRTAFERMAAFSTAAAPAQRTRH